MRLFITGTDTGVGKTRITAALASAVPGCTAIKPLASGSPPPGEDATRIAAAAGHTPQVRYCAPFPASPDRAMHEAGMYLDWAGLLAWIRDFPAPLLVEGVGGFAVPLDHTHRVSDLAVALGYPVLIVAANRLGVLSHTLLTAEAILARGLTLAGVVLNTVPDGAQPPLSHWNLSDLRRELFVPVVQFPLVVSDEEQKIAGVALHAALFPQP
ncbi:MAG: dethiobiotin synthetase [Myxococcota bacterium]|jgi:dethiobiotin synthetase